MGSPSRNVQYHPPRLSEDRLNLPQPHSPSLPTHCSGKSGMRPPDHVGRGRPLLQRRRADQQIVRLGQTPGSHAIPRLRPEGLTGHRKPPRIRAAGLQSPSNGLPHARQVPPPQGGQRVRQHLAHEPVAHRHSEDLRHRQPVGVRRGNRDRGGAPHHGRQRQRRAAHRHRRRRGVGRLRRVRQHVAIDVGEVRGDVQRQRLAALLEDLLRDGTHGLGRVVDRQHPSR